ncbi:MAG: hypothetical protein SV760_07760 [Halobacteria archaeon]|nr:hypothetical protein [Halobacteria archaeon]
MLDSEADCAECGGRHSLGDWLREDGSCPDCGADHVVPRLRLAVEAVEKGDFDGRELGEVVDELGLSSEDVTNLLLRLGCSAEAALDVQRVVFSGWERSGWRRFVGRTREEERRNLKEVEEELDAYGVEFDFPDE